jgi:hypothetical protein
MRKGRFLFCPGPGAAREGRTIVFVDESGLLQRPVRKRTRAPEGRTPVLEFNVNWKKLPAIAGAGLAASVSNCTRARSKAPKSRPSPSTCVPGSASPLVEGGPHFCGNPRWQRRTRTTSRLRPGIQPRGIPPGAHQAARTGQPLPERPPGTRRSRSHGPLQCQTNKVLYSGILNPNRTSLANIMQFWKARQLWGRSLRLLLPSLSQCSTPEGASRIQCA